MRLVPASCSLPEQRGEELEELEFVELPQEQARDLLGEYRDEARRLLPPLPKAEKRSPRPHSRRPRPRGPPLSHRMPWAAGHGEREGGGQFETQVNEVCP